MANSNQPGGNPNQFMVYNPQSPNPNPQIQQNPNPNSSSSDPPPHSSPYPFHQYPPQQMTDLHHQRSLPYPTPPHQPNAAGANLMALLNPVAETHNPIHRVNTPPGLFAGSNAHPGCYPNTNAIPPPPVVFLNRKTNLPSFPVNVSVPPSPTSTMMRLSSSKLPKGRRLVGERAAYDIDVRMEGEVQPQLEVTPITKYVSDPELVLGRQIAVNKSYICHGLKTGAIRVLNINTELKSLLKELTQSVTDMAFFAEDVHLLASASVDGRIYVWRLTEGPEEEDKAQIIGKVIIALQIVGEGESVHPRVCWHCHKQEVLVIGIGRSILRIDTSKVGKAKLNSGEEPLRFSVDNLIDGIQLVGKHEGEVTDLSMCQWMTPRLVSASTDGTIKIWVDRKAQPLLVLRPHGGQPVNSVTFLTAPTRPEHIILITGGPQNREMKIWVSGSEEGWLLSSDAESWHCTQTLEFKSSASRVEESFFNQVVALPQAGLLLLANAKKNAIYAVNLDYGPNPTATRMDYVAEFTVTVPILSFTGTSGSSDLSPHGENLVQVFCVQTPAIQQYALDLSLCLPPPIDNMVLEKSDSVILRDSIDSEGFASMEPVPKPVEVSLSSSAPRQSAYDIGSEPVTLPRHTPNSTSMDTAISADSSILSLESEPNSLSAISSTNDIACVVSSPLSLSPRLSEKFSGLRSPANGSGSVQVSDDHDGDKQVIEFSVDRQMDNTRVSDAPPVEDDSRSNENKFVKADTSSDHNQPSKYKHPTHLVTPTEILMATSSSDTSNVVEHINEGEPKVQGVPGSSDERNVEVDVKVVGEAGVSQGKEIASHGELPCLALENKEKVFCSQASDLGMETARDCSALSSKTYAQQESRSLEHTLVNESVTQASNADREVHDRTEDSNEGNEGFDMPTAVLQQQATPTTKGKKQKGKKQKGKKQKGKKAMSSGPSPAVPSDFNSTEVTSSLAVSSGVSTEQNLPSSGTIMELLYQMESNVNEDMAIIKDFFNEEGSRMEAMVDKTMKENGDVMFTLFHEEIGKQRKAAEERQQQFTNTIISEHLVNLKNIIRSEVAELGAAIPQALKPIIEKSISTAITNIFQRGVGDEAANLLRVDFRLEPTLTMQMESQFQTAGKQAIQEALKANVESTIVPALEEACKAMSEQVITTFQEGMVEHFTACLQLELPNSELTFSLRENLHAATHLSRTLIPELADDHEEFSLVASLTRLLVPEDDTDVTSVETAGL